MMRWKKDSRKQVFKSQKDWEQTKKRNGFLKKHAGMLQIGTNENGIGNGGKQ